MHRSSCSELNMRRVNMSDFLMNYILPNLIAFTIGALMTFFTTKYTATKSMKIEVKQRQFDFVYFPLYKTIRSDIGKTISKEKAQEYSTEITNTVLDNLQLVYSALLDLQEQFAYLTSNGEDHNKCFTSISKNIENEYFNLKRTLGYPSLTAVENFLRKPIKEKCKSVRSNSYILLIACFLFLCSWSFFKKGSSPLASLFFGAGSSFLVIFVLSVLEIVK